MQYYCTCDITNIMKITYNTDTAQPNIVKLDDNIVHP